jgi:ferredoxin/flavodoxin---NADP+ reductase
VRHELFDSRWLSSGVKRLVVHAPHVTHNWRAGQFVIVRPTARSERIPLTVAEADTARGTIVLIVQVVGATTRALCDLAVGECLSDVVGPLGRATDISAVAHAVLVGGGVGTAVVYPQARAAREAGCERLSAIVGGRSRSQILLEAELSAICDLVLPCTDDGSYGFHGLVTTRLKQLIDGAAVPVELVLCAGPVPMMRAVAETTRPAQIRTVASLNPIMVDGTGMCGGCRVRSNHQTKFACVDGPEFDAHQIDFDELSDRLRTYRAFECNARETPL